MDLGCCYPEMYEYITSILWTQLSTFQFLCGSITSEVVGFLYIPNVIWLCLFVMGKSRLFILLCFLFDSEFYLWCTELNSVKVFSLFVVCVLYN
jgi:hypothetical protein